MSQELAQDEDEAEDYEIGDLESGHRPLPDEEEEERGDGTKPYGRQGGPRGEINEESTVFALDDSDDESDEGDEGDKRKDGYRDSADFEDMGEEDGTESPGRGYKRRNS